MTWLRRGTLVLPAAALAVSAWLLAGCGKQSPGSAAVTQTDRPVEMTEVTYQGLDAAMKEQRGKVVMIDVWFYG